MKTRKQVFHVDCLCSSAGYFDKATSDDTVDTVLSFTVLKRFLLTALCVLVFPYLFLNACNQLD